MDVNMDKYEDLIRGSKIVNKKKFRKFMENLPMQLVCDFICCWEMAEQGIIKDEKIIKN
jgi:hypothetical protein